MDLLQPQDRRTSEFRGIEILMSDRVPPFVQIQKSSSTRLVADVQVLHFVPEYKPKSIVVIPNVSGIRITSLQPQMMDENIPECCLQKTSGNALHEVIRAFRVEISTESLKLGGEQDGVCLIDLLRGIAPSGASTTDAPMGSLHLIESGPPRGPPNVQRYGRHHASRRELKVLMPPSPASAVTDQLPQPIVAHLQWRSKQNGRKWSAGETCHLETTDKEPVIPTVPLRPWLERSTCQPALRKAQ